MESTALGESWTDSLLVLAVYKPNLGRFSLVVLSIVDLEYLR
jgi:hypothetical protein